MSTAQEHEIVPAIRDWLAATADLEIATGLSRDEARRHARELLAAIAVGSVAPDHVDADDDDLKDVLWAVVEELDEKPLGTPTFEECDRVYQFVAALSLERESFEERDDVLHRVARIGWRSSPGGLETILKARAAIWEHGDEQRHREVCETADQLSQRIQALKGHRTYNVAEISEICARLIKLTSIRPKLVAPLASGLHELLCNAGSQPGQLDNFKFLSAASALAAAMASRVLASWNSAQAGCTRAHAAFRRTSNTSDLDRVKVELVALQYARGEVHAAADVARVLIKGIVIPRERIKARLTLGAALVDLDRQVEAVEVLEAACCEPAIAKEPALWAFALMKLGNALSDLGRDTDAMANFTNSAAVLARYYHPIVVAALTCVMGEHFARSGNLEDAARLYAATRDIHRQVGVAQQFGYLSVLLAELLMLLRRDEEAEVELLAVLPLIEKFELRREAVAAAALLREAMAKRRTDLKTIQTLRDQLQ